MNKKIYIFILIILVAVSVIFIMKFNFTEFINGIPSGYIKKEEYYDQDGFQDYTDYAKYIYSSDSKFRNNKKYKVVKKNDIENIIGYFDNFSNWMNVDKRLNEYDFDNSMINEGDYVRIKTKEGKKIGDYEYDKYDDYTIYFFDIETLTLYYIHQNI